MPKIPTYEPQVPLTEQTTAREIPVGVGALVPDALDNIGKAVTKEFNLFAEHLDRVRAVQQYSESVTSAMGQLTDLQQGLTQDPSILTNPESAATTFRDKARAIRSQHLQQLSDPEVQMHFQGAFDRYALSKGTELTTWGVKKRQDLAQGSSLLITAKLRELAANATTQPDYDEAVQQLNTHYGAMIATGLYSAEEGTRRYLSDLSNISTAQVRRDIRINPEKALAGLDSGAYPHLAPEHKETLTTQAQKQIETDQRHQIHLVDRQDRLDEKRMKELRDNNEMDLWSEVNDGRGSVQKLEDFREKRLIDPAGYRALRAGIENETGVDDENTKTMLLDGILNGTVGRDDILKAKENHAISNKTAREYLEKARQTEKSDDISHDPQYKNATDFIDQQLKYTGPAAAVLDPNEMARRSTAKKEFDDRVRSGEDMWKVAYDIVPRYRLQPVTPEAFPRPKFILKREYTPESLDEAERVTIDQFKSGYIKADEMGRELRIIDQIKKALPPKVNTELPDDLKKRLRK